MTDPLRPAETDEEPWAVCEDDYRSGAVIVWVLGSLTALLIVVVAWMLLRE